MGLQMIQPEAVLKKLAEIDQEMRKAGVWDGSLGLSRVREQAGRIVSEQSESPVGLMPFEHWIQAVLILNARSAAQNGNLPSSSQVSRMALSEVDDHSHIPEAQALGEMFRDAGFEGVIVPSAVGDFKNLVFLVARLEGTSRAELEELKSLTR